MKVIQITLLIEDVELEKKLKNLEKRCKEAEISLENILSITTATMPYKSYIDVLLDLSNSKINNIEKMLKIKNILKVFKLCKKHN